MIQMLTLFSMSVVVNADLAQLSPDARTTDYFHAVLIYPYRIVVQHGTRGSYIKYGLDSQKESLKEGEWLDGPGWGADKQDSVLTFIEDSGRRVALQPTLPENYLAYYHGIHAAVRCRAPNPVPAEEAIRVMQLIELGIERANQRKTLPVKNG